MTEPRILILYDTADGHTRKVADRVARDLEDAGCAPSTLEARRAGARLRPDAADGVVLAGPVRFGNHPRKLRRFAKRNRDLLHRLPTALVTVSGAAMSGDPRALDEARGYADRFVEKTGWKPDRVQLVGGALAYPKYNPLLRAVMKSIARKAGLSTDTSRHHEYTDWDAVTAFARNYARLARGRRDRPVRPPA